jgi:membrane fusion protein, heavy metal efflux system
VAPVLAVPRSAVVTIDGRSVVFVAADNGSFARRTVELGRSGGGLVEVRAGVSEGERVVESGAFLLKSELAR